MATFLIKKTGGNANGLRVDGRIEAGFDAVHDVFEVRLGDAVEDLASLLVAVQKPTPLHQSQVFGRHRLRQLARLSQLTDRKLSRQQHLDHPQPMRMSQHPQALSRLAESREIGQLGKRGGGLCVAHNVNISEVRDMSMSCLGFFGEG